MTDHKLTLNPGDTLEVDVASSPTPPPPSTNPSGQAPPTTAPSGYKELYIDDFSGSALDGSKWGTYDNPSGRHHWEASHATVSGSVLSLTTKEDSPGQWFSGGVTSKLSLPNGALVLVRMRLDKGAGTRGVALLWPDQGWPPEVDFFEIGGTGAEADRQVATQTNHYGPSNQMQHTSYAVDATAWHTYGCIWTPTGISYTLDGVGKASADGHAPAQPMHLAMQTSTEQALNPANPAPPPGLVMNMEVDWVAIYEPAS